VSDDQLLARPGDLSPGIDPVKVIAPHIGTLREKSLHASLKSWYAQAGDNVEVQVDGFVIDVVRDDVLIEVQTSGFSSMKNKLATLLDLGHEIRVVHPIPAQKWIVKVDLDDTIMTRRRSPKHGRITDVFSELVGIAALTTHPNLAIEVILTEEEEHRRQAPGRSWRRHGWTIVERRLIDVVDRRLISTNEDLAALLPSGLPQPFTTSDLATTLERPRRLAQQMTYCLRGAGVIDVVGKSGNAVVYAVCAKTMGVGANRPR